MAQKTWLITGVNTGFGRLMTERLLERGDRVAGTVRKMDSMDDLKVKYADRLWLVCAALSEKPERRSPYDTALGEQH